MDRVERLAGKLAAVTERIEMLEAKPLNDKRAAKLERLRNRQDMIERKLDFGRDKFEISYDDGLISVAVTDSPFDSSLKDGGQLALEVDAITGKPNGRTSSSAIRFNLVNDYQWEGVDSQVFIFGSNQLANFELADAFTIGVKNDEGDLLAFQAFTANDFI